MKQKTKLFLALILVASFGVGGSIFAKDIPQSQFQHNKEGEETSALKREAASLIKNMAKWKAALRKKSYKELGIRLTSNWKPLKKRNKTELETSYYLVLYRLDKAKTMLVEGEIEEALRLAKSAEEEFERANDIIEQMKQAKLEELEVKKEEAKRVKEEQEREQELVAAKKQIKERETAWKKRLKAACGTDFDCFIEAVRQCAPRKLTVTTGELEVGKLALGFKLTSVFQVKGKQNNNCALHIRHERVELGSGLDEQTTKLANNLKGQKGICLFSMKGAEIERSGEGIFYPAIVQSFEILATDIARGGDFFLPSALASLKTNNPECKGNIFEY